MALPRWISRKSAQADAGPQQLAPVQTSGDQCEPLQISADQYRPLIVGTIHSPRERAILFVQEMVAAGYAGKSIYQADLAHFHRIICEERGWAPVSWLAICREMKRIGMRKAMMTDIDGERLTMYEIAAPPTNVMQLRKPA